MRFSTILLTTALVAASSPALANSFTNGDFTVLSNGPGQLTNNTIAAGWTVAPGGYTFVYAPGGIDQPGTLGEYGDNYMWGPNSGSANGLTGLAPKGGNIVAFDGAFQIQPLEQVITGLTIGKTYAIGFDYGFAQQFGFDGDTEQNWTVNFAGQSFTTPTYMLASHDFSGWFSKTVNFVANNATETLSFVAYGNLPVPPFALLSSVTFSQETGPVPEPASWAMLIVGFGVIGVAARRRRQNTTRVAV